MEVERRTSIDIGIMYDITITLSRSLSQVIINSSRELEKRSVLIQQLSTYDL